MKNLPLAKLSALIAGCAALALVNERVRATGTLPASAAALFGNAGVTFVFTPTANPGIFNVTADGVLQTSVTGNCTEHAELQVQFPPPGSQQRPLISGTATWTTSDGKSSVNLSVTGTVTPDPANPFIANNNYQATISGGTGAFASASGSASISEVVKFNPSFTGGTAGWTVKGYVLSPPSSL